MDKWIKVSDKMPNSGEYPTFLSKQYWKKRIFWSDGYFACSIGEVSSATIQKYIESQG